MRSFTENDPIAFLNQYAEGMLLDEVHHAPNLLSYIQGMVDEDTNRRFVLSGSSQFAMLKKITQSLARRTAVFELLPMSCAEIRKTATGVRRSTIYCSADSIRQSARDATCLNSSIRRM